jgi:hypothetical protein
MIREKYQVRTSLRGKNIQTTRDEGEMMHKGSSHIKFVDKRRKREERKATSSSNHLWERESTANY